MTATDTDFAERLAWSRGTVGANDADTIKKLMLGCVEVKPASTELDRKGIDFIATLRRGAQVFIDIKRRGPGVSRRWQTFPLLGVNQPEPELTLEIWSVVPYKGQPGKIGWTLDEAKLTDYILYLFDSTDTLEAFLIPFQLLRMATCRNREVWSKQWPHGRATTHGGMERGGWSTDCIYVPAWCVLDALQAEMRVLV